MNYKMVFHMLGKITLSMAALMLPCALFSVFTGDGDLFALIISAAIAALIGGGLILIKPDKTSFFAKEGFVVVALSWIMFSLVGALPFILGGVFTNYIDAVFETASGFTTTGATVCTDIDAIPRGIGLWRCLIIFIGGMGVLVFVMAVLPLSRERSMHIMRAEVPGPSVSKLVEKSKNTAVILYGIYLSLMLLQTVLLLFGGMNAYEAVTTAMSTAGTGGFMVTSSGMMDQTHYIRTVSAVFMLIFALNFNIYYYILLKKFKPAIKNEEIRWFLGIYIIAALTIALNIRGRFASFGEALHHAAFNAASIYSTTGFASIDFDAWPTLSKCILLLLMVFGGCAGSTAGGIKTSRVMILFKNGWSELRKMIHPKYIHAMHIDGRAVSEPLVRSVLVYFSAIAALMILSVLLVAANGESFETTVSAVFACVFNVGPGFDAVGPTCDFSHLSYFSKIVLTLDMLFGRLEIWPMLLLFTPETWHKRFLTRPIFFHRPPGKEL